MDNDEMDKLLRNQDSLLYDSVMGNLYNVKSIEDFKDKGKRLGKRDIGLETPAIYLLVFNPDPEISWSNIDIQLTGRLYKSDGTPVIDLFEALITIYQVIHAEFDYQLQKNNVERWMDNRLNQFDEWIYHLVGEELNNRNKKTFRPNDTEILPLFKDNDVIPKAIKALQAISKLDETGKFIKGPRANKGAIVAWNEILQVGKFLNAHNDIQRANLINKLIPNLSISDRVLREPGTRDYKKHFTILQTIISKF